MIIHDAFTDHKPNADDLGATRMIIRNNADDFGPTRMIIRKNADDIGATRMIIRNNADDLGATRMIIRVGLLLGKSNADDVSFKADDTLDEGQFKVELS